MNQIAIMESKIEVLGKQVDDRDMELSAIYKAILARLEELANAKLSRSEPASDRVQRVVGRSYYKIERR
jgi:hypothetical protein